MDIYSLNNTKDMVTYVTTNRYFSEVIPTILKYKLISLNDGNLFTKSEDVKEISKEERDKIIAERSIYQKLWRLLIYIN